MIVAWLVAVGLAEEPAPAPVPADPPPAPAPAPAPDAPAPASAPAPPPDAPAPASAPAPAPAPGQAPDVPAPAPAPDAPAPDAPAPTAGGPAPAPADAPPSDLSDVPVMPLEPLEVAPVVEKRSGVVDRVAAVVNNEVITLSDVYELAGDFIAKRCPAMDHACVSAAELEVLDSQIRRVLMRQELEKLSLDVTQAEVDQAIDRTVQQYQLPDRAALRAEVEASGRRWEDYREELTEYLRGQAFQGRVLAGRVSISEDELRDVYQRTARDVTRPVVKLSGLGIAIPPGSTPEQAAEKVALAEAVAAKINAGELAWADAVDQYDDGASGMFVGQEFDEASMIEPLQGVFDAPTGVVQPPIRVAAPTGVDVLFVLRVDERSERAGVAPFEEVRDQIQDQVFQEKLKDAEEEWYQRARREAAVTVKLSAES